MTYISAASNIRFDKRDIELIKLNNIIVYERRTKAEDLYIEYQVIDTDYKNAYIGNNLPTFYLKDGTCIEYYGADHSYDDFIENIEITLKDGSVSNRIIMSYMCNEISNIKIWYPKSVVRIQFDYTDMYHYPQIESITYCNTRFLNNMAEMFHFCRDTTSLDLSSFDTYKVTDMNFMFSECYSLTSLNLSDFNTKNVTNMCGMFYYCYSLTSLDLSNFDTRNVTKMKQMFHFCDSLTSLDLSNFNMVNVTNTDYMFYDCPSLHTLRLDNCNYDTIYKIINSYEFPINKIEGITRKIYVKKSNAGDLEPPTNWEFEYIPEISYDEPTEALLVPESMTEAIDEQLTINQATYDPDNENLNIN